MPGERGSLLLHPVHLIAVTVLGVNDHWLKEAWPGSISGKLSDVAGLIVLPIVVVAAGELLLRRPLDGRVMCSVALACAAGFAIVKTWRPATEMFAAGLGWLQWLCTGADGMAHTVAVTLDVTDLIALPAAAIPAMLLDRGDPVLSAVGRVKNQLSRRVASHR